MRKNIYEILEQFERAENKVDRLYVLRTNDTLAFKAVLQNTFHPNINWIVKDPKDIPLWKPTYMPEGMGYGTLATELRKLYLWRDGNPDLSPKLTMEKRKTLLTETLELMEPREGDVMLKMMMKDLKIKHLTYDLVKEAFPDLLP